MPLGSSCQPPTSKASVATSSKKPPRYAIIAMACSATKARQAKAGPAGTFTVAPAAGDTSPLAAPTPAPCATPDDSALMAAGALVSRATEDAATGATGATGTAGAVGAVRRARLCLTRAARTAALVRAAHASAHAASQ